MAHYIPLDAVLAEIDKLQLCTMDEHMNYYSAEAQGEYNALSKLESFLDTLEVKEVDADLEKKLIKWHKEHFKKDGTFIGMSGFYLTNSSQMDIAKYFFELGMRVNNPITAADRGIAEEIIINLKRVEQDYRINLTKEMEWLRNQVKKGEKV